MKKLRIAVDGHRVAFERQTSGHQYLALMLPYWNESPKVEHIYLLIPKTPTAPNIPPEVSELRKVVIVEDHKLSNPFGKWRRQFFYQQFTLPRLLALTDANVYFSPFHLAPVRTRNVPVVTAIHDLCVLSQPTPSLGYLKHREIHRFQIQLAAWKSDQLVAVSKFTAGELDRYLKVWRPMINVVPNGLEPQAVVDLPNQQAVKSDPFLLWVGYPGYRKNPELMLESFKQMRENRQDLRLTCVIPSRAVGVMRELAARANVTEYVDFQSNLSPASLAALYKSAELCVVSSRCEGFGYPLLESLSYGCPAIGWENSPAAEIVGGLLTLPKSLNSSEFARCAHLIPSKGSRERAELEEKLMLRAQKFSVKETSDRMITVFLKSMENHT